MISSHRQAPLLSAKLADKIIVLDGGEVKEQVTHDHLMALGGIYCELYDKHLQTKKHRRLGQYNQWVAFRLTKKHTRYGDIPERRANTQ